MFFVTELNFGSLTPRRPDKALCETICPSCFLPLWLLGISGVSSASTPQDSHGGLAALSTLDLLFMQHCFCCCPFPSHQGQSQSSFYCLEQLRVLNWAVYPIEASCIEATQFLWSLLSHPHAPKSSQTSLFWSSGLISPNYFFNRGWSFVLSL